MRRPGLIAGRSGRQRRGIGGSATVNLSDRFGPARLRTLQRRVQKRGGMGTGKNDLLGTTASQPGLQLEQPAQPS